MRGGGYFVIKQDRVREALIHRFVLWPERFAIKRQLQHRRLQRDVERINEKEGRRRGGGRGQEKGRRKTRRRADRGLLRDAVTNSPVINARR